MTGVTLSQGLTMMSGALFDYNRPEDSDVIIEDIAAALSKVCRFAGHIHRFYSVAQHSINVSMIVAPAYAYAALMHDTAEAFTNDLPTPLKHAFPVLKELEHKIETAMGARFGFSLPMPAEVKVADLQMLKIEKELLKQDFNDWDILNGVRTDHIIHMVRMRPMAPEEAEAAFLERYHLLRPTQEQAVKGESLVTMAHGICDAAVKMLDAYGGDIPDWIRPDAKELAQKVDVFETLFPRCDCGTAFEAYQSRCYKCGRYVNEAEVGAIRAHNAIGRRK